MGEVDSAHRLEAEVAELRRELAGQRERYRELESRLSESEEWFRMIFDRAGDGIALYAVEDGRLARFLAVNATICQRLGYSREEILKRKPDDLFDRGRLPEVQEIMRRLLEQGKIRVETTVAGKDGRELPVEINSQVLEWKGKQVVLSISRDITERKQGEDAFQAMAREYETVFNCSSTPMFLLDIDEQGRARRRRGNPAHEALTGIRNSDAAGKIPSEFMDEKMGQEAEAIIRHCIESQEPISYVAERVYPAGRRTLHFTLTPVTNHGRVVQIVGSNHDLTELKYLEQELQRREEKYRTLFDNALEAIFLFKLVEEGPPSRLLEVNQTACTMLGYSREELLTMTAWDLDAPEELVRIPAIRREFVELGQSVFEMDMLTKDGRRIPLEFNTRTFVLNGEKVVLSIARDLTERRRTEQALRSSEERFTKAFHSNPCLMYISSVPEHRYLDVNAAWMRYTGYSRGEALGKTPVELNVAVSPEKFGRHLDELLSRGRSSNLEINYRTKGGEIREGLLSREIIEVNGEACILSVINDLSERRQLEREMTRLDRLNLLGQMAASIGHEIRNPLTTVRGFLQLLNSNPELEGYQNYFTLMIGELDRASGIVSEFLTLARNKKASLRRGSLDLLLQRIYPLVAADALHTGHQVSLELGDTAELQLDEGEIYQMVLNLVRNGKEAMPEGGCLTIRTYGEEGETVLAVRDQGCGIPGEMWDKIGLPFFTTKDNGTGLGLATCYSIAARHGARIRFETGPGGTTFQVRFGAQVSVGAD